MKEWMKKIRRLMARNGESWDDVVGDSAHEKLPTYNGCSYVAWTRKFIYFHVYGVGGDEFCGSFARNPPNEPSILEDVTPLESEATR